MNDLQRRDDAQQAIAKPLFALLQKRKKQIEAIVPNFLTPERVLNLVNTAILRTPALVECSPHSVVNAIMHATILGLEIAPEQAYLIPFRVKGKMQCQLLIDYRGKRDVVVSAGLIKNIHPYVVYSRDDFAMDMDPELGTMRVKYSPWLGERTKSGELLPIDDAAQRGKPIGILSIAPFTAGGADVLWMPMHEINAVRARSRAKDDGPWVTDFLEMAKKTAVHRHCKSLPKPRNAEAIQRITKAQEIDDRFEMGEQLEELIDVDFEDEKPMIMQGTTEDQQVIADRKIEAMKTSGATSPAAGSGAPAALYGGDVAGAPERDLTPEENRALDAQIVAEDERRERTQQQEKPKGAGRFGPRR